MKSGELSSRGFSVAPSVTIVTPTYNKPERFAECAAAVLAQSFADWTWWVVFNEESWVYGYPMPPDPPWNDPRVNLIWYPIMPHWRHQAHIPARIVNWLYPKVTTPYIYFLADDDLIDPDGLGVLVSAMLPEPGMWHEDGTGLDAVYGRCEVQSEQPDGSFVTTAWCYPGPVKKGADISANISFDVGLGTGVEPHCRLDGGQVLHTADLWSRATADGWQLTDSKDDAAANDGTLLNRLAEFARFHYVPQRIVTHRRTYESTFHKPQVSP